VEAPAEWEVTVEPGQTTSEKDDLKVIRGIGPAIEKKLNHAGIQTFAALAELSRAELETILGSQIKRLQDENDLIAQAKKLARQK
jgi:predicted flap endonuclease-1-like 5' DNA nuclease